MTSSLPQPPAVGEVPAATWQELHRAAEAACARAYAPYSNFPVGAAALVDDGRIVSGCNVENASYGLTLCAECGLVSDLVAGGGGRLVALVCVDATGGPLMPCGRCRQLLWEHAAPGLQVQGERGLLPIRELLPYAFGRDDLDRVATVEGRDDVGPSGPASPGSGVPAQARTSSPGPRRADPRDTAALYRAVAAPSPDRFDPEDLR